MPQIHFPLFKKFGVSDKESFTPEEYQALLKQYSDLLAADEYLKKLKELKSKKPNPPAQNSAEIEQLQKDIEALQYQSEDLQKLAADIQERTGKLDVENDAHQALTALIAQQIVNYILDRIAEIGKEIEEKQKQLTKLQNDYNAAVERYNSELQKWEQEYNALKEQYLNILSKYNLSSPEEV